MRKQFRDLASLDEALAVLEDLALEPTVEEVSLEAANGRLLAASIRSPIDVPGFDRSIMDGYAVRADDTAGAYDDDPAVLTYAGKVVPGEAPGMTVGAEEAIEIATGAVIPDEADAVVKVEDTARTDDVVAVHRPVTPRANVMGRGADIPVGETVLRAGVTLDARRIGLLAAIGVDRVSVRRRPRVGLISTGSEIVRPGDRTELAPGEIFDINAFSVAAAVEDAGGVPEIRPHVEDDYELIREAFVDAVAACDLVVSSGSTSASEEDVVYRLVEDAGELLLHGIAVKPGKPTVFGRIDGTPVIGLPGNPISALMNYRLFAAPLVRSALGEAPTPRGVTTHATLATHIDSLQGRTQLAPVGLVESPERGLLAYGVDKGSGAITSLADADGYLTIPDTTHYLEAGATVEVAVLGDAVRFPDVFLVGEACPLLESVLEGAMAADAVRWLTLGSDDGLRKLRDGVADVAAVSLPPSRRADVDLEDATVAATYARRQGFVHRGESDADPAALLEGGATVATLPRGTGLWYHAQAALDALDASVTLVDRPSPRGVLRAVTEGAVDAGFLLAADADASDQAFLPTGWSTLEVVVADERRDKPGVEELLEAVEAADLEDMAGIRRMSPE